MKRRGRWRYSTEDIALAAGVGISVVRRAMKCGEITRSRKRSLNDVGMLESVVAFIVKRRGVSERPELRELKVGE